MSRHRPRSSRRSGAACLLLSVLVLVAAACSRSGGASPPESSATTSRVEQAAPAPVSTAAGRRTVAVVEPDGPIDGGIFRIVVVDDGEMAHGRITSAAGPFGEELLDGERLFVRLDDADEYLGYDGWIQLDLSDPREAEFVPALELGLVALARPDDLSVGDRVLGGDVTSIEGADGSWTIEVGGGGDGPMLVVVDQEPTDEEVHLPADGDWVPIAELDEVASLG